MSNQTAVQWLHYHLLHLMQTREWRSKDLHIEKFDELFIEALQMEREQMGLPNCKPMDEQIISVTILDPATGKTYTRKTDGFEETYKGGEQ